MHRQVLRAPLLLLGIALLAGCGQKGALFLPPPKPTASPAGTATTAPRLAPASSTAAPATPALPSSG